MWVVIALFSQKRRNAGNAGNAGKILGDSFGIIIIMFVALGGRKVLPDFHTIVL